MFRMESHPAAAGHNWSPPVLPEVPTDRFSTTFMTACAIPSPVTLNPEITLDPTLAYVAAPEAEPPSTGDSQLLGEEFQRMLTRDEVAWEQSYDLVEKLGAGGQGVVFLADRHGAFDVKFRLALKFFRPDGYASVKAYRDEMARLARVAMELASVQQDHLLDIFNVIELKEDAMKLLSREQLARGPMPRENTPLNRASDMAMWGLLILGPLLLLGLCTRLAAVGGAVMLLSFYLVVPPWPGVPQPPGPEHSFIVNKNLIEVIALLAIAFMPTGSWFGLDGVFRWLFRRGKGVQSR